ncbi:MAG: tetratricopeptide repeat protein [Steroidobacteraceae bacterium]
MVTDLQTVLREANSLCQQQKLHDARTLLQRTVNDNPTSGPARLLLARVQIDLAQWAEARASALAALTCGGLAAAAWYALGRAAAGLEAGDQARNCLRRALLTAPNNPAILTSLGTALFEIGRREEAIKAYRMALSADPHNQAARTSLDMIQGKRATEPARLRQLAHEAQRLQLSGKLWEALKKHQEALLIAPDSARIWLSAAAIATELGDRAASLPLFETAARLQPSLFAAVEAARRICGAAGLAQKARYYSDLALAMMPSNDIRVARSLLIEAIQPSPQAIEENRHCYELGVAEAIAAGSRCTDIAALLHMSLFYLAYHGMNDRALQTATSALFRRAIADLAITAPHCNLPRRRPGPIRLGLISAFLYSHSIGKTTRGLIANLSREAFEVIALRITPSKQDDMTRLIRAQADRTVDLDADFRVAREQIAALQLDVLFYQDIGMEPASYLLAHSRLAPVQCVSFGHPNTTGISTMDYFVSNDLYEPQDATSHYSEELFALRDLPTLAYYYRPEPPGTAPRREQFGLADTDHVYVCPQTLFKVHPEFDAIVAEILRRDPLGIVVFLRGAYDDYAELLLSRFSRNLPDVRERVLMLDPMRFEYFLQLLTVADVCLDTVHFNGMNSSLEAFAVGTPIVTLPGRLQRGRHTQAMYRKMGIHDCIATDTADYIEIAVRLACDAEFAAAIRRRILSENRVLYENEAVVREFERFFFHALRHKRPLDDWQQNTRSVCAIASDTDQGAPREETPF